MNVAWSRLHFFTCRPEVTVPPERDLIVQMHFNSRLQTLTEKRPEKGNTVDEYIFLTRLQFYEISHHRLDKGYYCPGGIEEL